MELWADNTTGVLVEAIAAGATSITVQTLTGAFPTISSSGQIFHVILNGGQPGAAASNTEIVVVTATSAVSGTNYIAFTLQNPTLYAHAQNEYCAAVLTAEALNALEADVIGIVSIQGPGTTTEGDALFTVNSSAEERIILDDGTGYMGIPTEGGLVIGVNNPSEPLNYNGNPSPGGLAAIGGNVGFFGLSFIQDGSLTVTPAVTGTTSYTYAMELTDRNGNTSGAILEQTITNGPATISSTDYITITTPPITPGAVKVTVMRLDTPLEIVNGVPNSITLPTWYLVGTADVAAQNDTITFTDTGGTTAYVPASEDQTMAIGQFGRAVLGSQVVSTSAMITAPFVTVNTITANIVLALPISPIIGEAHTIVYTGSFAPYSITVQDPGGIFWYQIWGMPHTGITVVWDGTAWLAQPIGIVGTLQGGTPLDTVIIGNGAYPFGNDSNAGMEDYLVGDVIIGAGAHDSSSSGVGSSGGLTVIGYNASAQDNGTAIGANAVTTNAVAVGYGATTGLGSNEGVVAVGYEATATGDYSIAIGQSAKATYGSDIAIGSFLSTAHYGQVMLGGYVACKEGIEFPGATYISATGSDIAQNSTVTFLNPPSGSTVTMPTMYEGQLMWLVNMTYNDITVDMASGQTVLVSRLAGAPVSSFLLTPGATYCIYLPPVDPLSGGTSNTVAIVISNNLPSPVANITSFLDATLAVAATTATTITSVSLNPGTWDLSGIVSWEAGTVAAEVGAWFALGTAVGTLITTTDTSTTNTLGAGEACTKPVGSVTITTAGTVDLVGEASAALTVTNTAIYGPANTATGIIAKPIAL